MLPSKLAGGWARCLNVCVGVDRTRSGHGHRAGHSGSSINDRLIGRSLNALALFFSLFFSLCVPEQEARKKVLHELHSSFFFDSASNWSDLIFFRVLVQKEGCTARFEVENKHKAS